MNKRLDLEAIKRGLGESGLLEWQTFSPRQAGAGPADDMDSLFDEFKVSDPAVRSRLRALAQIESSGNWGARGPEIEGGMHAGTRAHGLFQIMPATAQAYPQYNIQDDRDAARAGLRYFLDNYERFGDLDLATIAHHGGPGAAERYLRTGSAGVRDRATGLPTDDYLRKVIGVEGSVGSAPEAGQTPRNPNRYGMPDTLPGTATLDLAERQAIEAQERAAIEKGRSVMDLVRAAQATAGHMISDVGWGAEKLTGFGSWLDGIGQSIYENAEANMTPAMRASREKMFIEENVDDRGNVQYSAGEAWGDPWALAGAMIDGVVSLLPLGGGAAVAARATMARSARAATASARAMGLTGEAASRYVANHVAVSGARAAARAGFITGAIGEGVLQGTSYGRQAGEFVRNMDFADLEQRSELYRSLIEQGMSPDEAREEVALVTENEATALAGGVGTATGSVMGYVVGRLASGAGLKFTAQTAAGRAGQGVLGAAAMNAIQEGVSQAAANIPVQRHADEDHRIGHNVADVTVRGAIGGGPLGALAGLAGGGEEGGNGGTDREPVQPPPNSPLTAAAMAAQQAGALVPAGEPVVDPNSFEGRLDRVRSFVEDNELVRAIRGTKEFGAESVNELLSAWAKARNPNVSPLMREQALQGIEQFLDSFLSRPNFTFGHQRGEPEQGDQFRGDTQMIEGPAFAERDITPRAETDQAKLIEAEDVMRARVEARAAYEQAFEDLRKAEQLGAADAELMAYQQAVKEAQALRENLDARLADIQAAIEGNRQLQVEQSRMGALDRILADPETVNPLHRFRAELERMGLDATPTSRERQAIARFEDLRNARREEHRESGVEPSAPNELQPYTEATGAAAPAAPQSSRDRVSEIRDLIGQGWRLNNRALVGPRGQRRNLNAVEYAAAKEAARRANEQTNPAGESIAGPTPEQSGVSSSTQAPTAPEQSKPAPSQRSESAQPTQPAKPGRINLDAVRNGTDLTPRQLSERAQQWADELRSMAPNAGWSQIGGRIYRDAEGNIAGRTEWIPNDSWFAAGMVAEPDVLSAAIENMLRGEALPVKAHRTVEGMIQWLEAQQQSRDVDPDASYFDMERADYENLDDPVQDGVDFTDEAEYRELTEAEAMAALGFSQEEINEAVAQGARVAGEVSGDDAGTAGAVQTGDENFDLSPYSAQELAEQESRRLAAEQAEAQARAEADRRAQADAERDSFVLTGSDRQADVLAAQGQGGLFDAPPPAAPQRVASLFGDGTPDPRNSPPMQSLGGFAVGDTVEVPGRTIGRSVVETLFLRSLAGEAVEIARVTSLATGKRLDVVVSELRHVDDGKAAIRDAVAQAEDATDRAPTDKQKEAGNYAKGKLTLHGQNIAVETPKGAERSGMDESGERWSVTMPVTYGYFLGTEAVDGDHVDVFIGPRPEAGMYWVVNQVKPDSTKYDEPKFMLGFDDAQQARQAYLDSFTGDFGDRVFGNMVGPFSVAELGAMLEKMGRKTPVKGDVAASGRLFESTAPEHSAVGVDEAELSEIVAEFNDAQASMLEGDDRIHHLFDAPAKSEVVRLADKAKVYHKDHGWMTPAEAREVIAGWKEHAANQNNEQTGNNQRVVLSLFDYTGKWSQPWEEAGYQVFRFDIQQDPEVGDVNNFSTEFFADWFGDFEGMDIYAILAACPCTDFASSGARHFAAKDQDGRTVASVRLVHQTLATIEHFRPAIWALENPVGRIEKLGVLPPWRLSFDPNHLGDPYTKKTLIWGRFNGDLPVVPVEPTEGSKMHSQYGGKSLATKNARSATPEGFAYGFFMANNAHDHPAMAVSFKYDRLDRGLIEEAIEAGVTPEQINRAVEDFYYMDLDDGAANDAIRELTAEAKQGEEQPEAPTSTTALAVQSFQHTKTGETIYAVQLPNRVEKEAYQAAKRRALAHKGRYSNFKAAGVIPGFHFKSEANAKAFAADPAVLEAAGVADATSPLETSSSQAVNDFVAGRRDDVPTIAEVEAERSAVALQSNQAEVFEYDGIVSGFPSVLYRQDGVWYREEGGTLEPVGSREDDARLLNFIERYPNEWVQNGTVDVSSDGVVSQVGKGLIVDAEAVEVRDQTTVLLSDDSAFSEAEHRVDLILSDKTKALTDRGVEQSQIDQAVAEHKDGDSTLIDDLLRITNPEDAPSPGAVDLGAMFDDFLAEEIASRKPAKEKKPRAKKTGGESAPRTGRTAGAAAKSAAKNAGAGMSNAMQALGELFGGKGRLSSGLSFDEQTYAKAKPLFIQAAKDFSAAGTDVADVMRAIVKAIVDAFGVQVAGNMKPYAVRFVQDVRDGKIDYTETEGTQERTTNERRGTDGESDQALGRVPAGEDGGSEGSRDTGVQGKAGGRARNVRNSATGTPRPAAARGGRDGSSGVHNPAPGTGSVTSSTPAKNFVITDIVRLGEGGEVTKFKDNVAAIQIVKKLDAERRRATPEEQAELARYVGWGGLAQAFRNPQDKSVRKGWEDRVALLEALLSPDELKSARATTTDAHYTSKPVVEAAWQIAERMGFAGGVVLESSVGVGNFIGLMPESVRGTTRVQGVEVDGLTVKIARALYPQESILHSPFQNVPMPANSVEMAIGNPPFGKTSLYFPYSQHLNGKSIHNQFILGAMDAVKPGGFSVQVVSRFFMDAKDSTSRRQLSEQADLVAAIRLPDTAFVDNALTEVVTDMLVIRKLTNEEVAERAEAAGKNPAPVPSWVETTEVPDPLGGEPITINRYFAEKPEMMLGVMERSGSMRRENDATLRAPADMDIGAALAERIMAIPQRPKVTNENIEASLKQFEAMRESLELTIGGFEEGAVIFNEDGDLVQVTSRESSADRDYLTRRVITPASPWHSSLMMDADGNWFRVTPKLDESGNKVKDGRFVVYDRETFKTEQDVPENLRLGDGAYRRLLALANMRDTLKRQLVMEAANEPESAIEENRAKLRKEYEEFTQQHGFVGDRANQSLLAEMPDGPLLAALELSYDQGVTKARAARTGEKVRKPSATPAPIMSQRVVTPYSKPSRADSQTDALFISLTETGRVDLARMAELLDTTEDAVIKELFESRDDPLIFKDPESGRWETRDAYLSGQVVRKLAAAIDAGLDKHIKALRAVQPEPIDSSDIAVRLGSVWVPDTMYAEFIEHITGSPARVRFAKAMNSFDVIGNSESSAATAQWGTQRMPAPWIISAKLNSKNVVVYDYFKDEHGNKKRVVNEEETQLAEQKALELESEFADWIMATPERRDALTNIYNEQFNNRVIRQYDGSFLSLPGKVPDAVIKLRTHQRNAVWRGISERFMLFDHAVGAGKTFTAIARAMERRRMGLSKKPMMVVPNHMVEQFATDVYRLYPGANVLAMGKKDLEAKRRRRAFARIATGDWDIVVIPHSSFEFINIAPEREARYIEERINEVSAAIAEASAAKDGQGKPPSVKSGEATLKVLQARLAKLNDKPRDRLLTLEELGVDDLTVDEAHEFKNLEYTTKLEKVLGLGSQQGSKKAFGLYNKVRTLRESPTGSVVFMTGTPISNSVVEMYTMMRYLANDTLADMGIEHFDAWQRQFAEVESKFEVNDANQLEQKSRLSRWSNMPELMKIYYSFSDSVSLDDIKETYRRENNGKEFPVPRAKGGKPDNVVVQPTEAQQSILDAVVQGFMGLKSIGDRKERNKARLRLMDLARKVSLDARVADPSLVGEIDEAGGKLDVASRRIYDIYKAWNADKGTQLVFLDRSTPKTKKDAKVLAEFDRLQAKADEALRRGDEDAFEQAQEQLDKYDRSDIEAMRAAQAGGWNAYDQIKQNLIALGIPENEVRFIHEANTDEQKQQIFDAVNAGDIRVLIGSTARMGAGTNVQDRLVGLHHLDVNWKPSDIEQREGRIIRQGNKLLERYGDEFEVEIVRYATERTYDAKMWGLNETKGRFINGLRKYDGAREIEIEDADSENMAEMAALASGDPRMLERVQLDAELKKLEMAKRAHYRRQGSLQDQIQRAELEIETAPAKIERLKVLARTFGADAEAAQAAKDALSIEIEGETFNDATQAESFARSVIEEMKGDNPKARFVITVDGKPYSAVDAVSEAITDTLGDKDPVPFVLPNGERPNRRLKFGEYVATELAKTAANSPSGSFEVGTVHGLPLSAYYEQTPNAKKTIVTLYVKSDLASDAIDVSSHKEGMPSPLLLSNYASKLARGIRNIDEPADIERRVESAKESIPKLREQFGKPFTQQEEYDTKRSRLSELVQILAAEGKNIVDDDGSAPAVLRAADPDPGSVDGVVSIPDAQAAVDRFVGAFPGSPNFVLVSSFSDLPLDVQRDANNQQGGEGSVKGAFKHGKVYLVVRNHKSVADFEATIFHESIGHAGVRQMLGPGFIAELNWLFVGLGGAGGLAAIMRRRGFGQRFIEYIEGARAAQKTDPAQWNEALVRAVLTEEVFAHIAEQQKNRPRLMDRIKALIGRVRQWLRDHGLMELSELGETDLLHMLDLARRKVGETNGDGGPRGGMPATLSLGEPTGRVRNSPVVKDNQRAALFTALARFDDAFQQPTPKGKTVEAIAREIDPEYRAKALPPYQAKVRSKGRATRAWQIGVPESDVRSGFLFEDDRGRVWVDVHLLHPRIDSGSTIYGIAAGYAHNTGKVFIGDPEGLSPIALFRRLENMISSALRYGTTDHLYPHAAQVDPQGYYSHVQEYPDFAEQTKGLGLDWRDGNFSHNLTEMLRVSYDAAIRFAPELQNVIYDFESRQFVDARTGERRTVEAEQNLARRLGGQVPARYLAGSSTQKRAALVNTLARGEGPEAWRAVLAGLVAQLRGRGLDYELSEIFYRKTDTPADSGLSAESFRAALVERFGEDGVAALESQGLLNIVGPEESQPGNPAWYQDGKAFFVPEYHASTQDAVASVLHEVGEHFGLEGMLGERGWRTLKARVARLAAEGSPDVRAAWEGVLDQYSQFQGQPEAGLIGNDQFMHEVIAKLGERAAGRKSSIWRDMLAAVNRFLLKMGIGRQINKNEIADLVEGSLKRVMGGQGPDGGPRGRMDSITGLASGDGSLSQAMQRQSPEGVAARLAERILASTEPVTIGDYTFEPPESDANAKYLEIARGSGYIGSILNPTPKTVQETLSEMFADDGALLADARRALREDSGRMNRISFNLGDYLPGRNNQPAAVGFGGPRIESRLKHFATLRGFFESAADLMKRTPGLEGLGKAVVKYYDQTRANRAAVAEPELRAKRMMEDMKKADRERLLADFEAYRREFEQGRKAEADRILKAGHPRLSELNAIWQEIAEITGDMARDAGVMVQDAKTGEFRPMGKVKNFWPRTFREDVQQALDAPHKHPAKWNELLDAVVAEGLANDPDEAAQYLMKYRNEMSSNVSDHDYFAGIEKGRAEPLPEAFYDYSWEAGLLYKEAWADRLAQIQAFGQSYGQGPNRAKDLFEVTLDGVRDERTRDYINRVRAHAYVEKYNDPLVQAGQFFNTVATGLQLGNPATALLNLIGGTSLTFQAYGFRRSVESLFETIKEFRQHHDNAFLKGVLTDDYLQMMHDSERSGVPQLLQKAVSLSMKVGGYTPAEHFIRTHNMVVGKAFLRDALREFNENPGGKKAAKFAKWMQENGFNPDDLVQEKGKGPETDRFIRYSVNLTQGSYRIDQTPLFVDSAVGRILFKYQKFGTQLSRMFWKNHLRPFVESIQGGEKVDYEIDGVKYSARLKNFIPLLRFFAVASAAGLMVMDWREKLFGYQSKAPSWGEIDRALQDDDAAKAIALAADRAWQQAMAVGALGFFGNYWQLAHDVADRQRVRSPLDPPALAPIKSFGYLVLDVSDQGTITARNFDNFMQETWSMYRTVKRAGSRAYDATGVDIFYGWQELNVQAAKSDVAFVKKMTRRYAAEAGIEAKRRAADRVAATENTPFNNRVVDAILVGDVAQARVMVREHFADRERFPTEEDRRRAMMSLKATIRSRDPSRVGIAPSESERQAFLRWARQNTNDREFARIQRITNDYRQAAQRAGLY